MPLFRGALAHFCQVSPSCFQPIAFRHDGHPGTGFGQRSLFWTFGQLYWPLYFYLLWVGARVAFRHGAYSEAGAKCSLPIVFFGLKSSDSLFSLFYWEASPFRVV